jgi:LPS-assembly lipoprotein
MARLTKWLVGGALALQLGACGYHLRGAAPLTWHLGSIYLQDVQAGRLGAEVRRQMSVSGVQFAASPQQADIIVTVGNEAYDRRVLSVDPDTGKVREYEIDIFAALSAVKGDGTVLLDKDEVHLQRDYVFEEGTALGKFAEEETLQADLREDAAQTILRRLQALGAGRR